MRALLVCWSDSGLRNKLLNRLENADLCSVAQNLGDDAAESFAKFLAQHDDKHERLNMMHALDILLDIIGFS